MNPEDIKTKIGEIMVLRAEAELWREQAEGMARTGKDRLGYNSLHDQAKFNLLAADQIELEIGHMMFEQMKLWTPWKHMAFINFLEDTNEFNPTAAG